jgi:phosphatidylserine/phosphatidylglycerophosphate/cardiolipin synthase-like enzyme
MAQPSKAAIDAFKALAGQSEIAAAICSAVASSKFRGFAELWVICERSGIASARSAEVRRFLDRGYAVGLFSRRGELEWKPLATPSLFAELAPLFFAVSLYRKELHSDADRVEVALTSPPEPSQLVQALGAMLQGTWGIQATKQVFPDLANRAQRRYCIMSPFLDSEGGEMVLDLFARTASSVSRELIIRGSPDGILPKGYSDISSALRAMNVSVFNFRLERGNRGGSETFHAKVVLADEDACYIGSSNMTKWSLDYSLELGLVVFGQAAARVARILDAVRSVATPIW